MRSCIISRGFKKKSTRTRAGRRLWFTWPLQCTVSATTTACDVVPKNVGVLSFLPSYTVTFGLRFESLRPGAGMTAKFKLILPCAAVIHHGRCSEHTSSSGDSAGGPPRAYQSPNSPQPGANRNATAACTGRPHRSIPDGSRSRPRNVCSGPTLCDSTMWRVTTPLGMMPGHTKRSRAVSSANSTAPVSGMTRRPVRTELGTRARRMP